MSDSSPENFMEQALALITELKKALTESFSAQDKHIDKRIDAIIKVLGEQVATQQQSIDKNATDFTSLNNDFQKHTHSNYVSQSSMNDAIKAQTQSHDLKLEEIKSGYISVQEYNTQIQEFKNEIAALKKQIPTTTQSTTLSEEGTSAPKVTEPPKPKSDDAQIDTDNQLPEQTGATPPSDENGEDNTTTEDSAPQAKSNPSAAGVPPTQDTQHNQSTPPKSTTPPTDPTVNDPNASTLKTAILKAILASTAYTSIINTNRGLILKKANPLVSSTVNDTVLHIQVILALYYLIDLKSKTRTLSFYNKCYQNNSEELKRLQPIIESFIGSNELKVTHDTFQKAIHDSNFKNIMPTDVVLTTNFDANFIDPIIKPKKRS
jgi:hypothetical protein